MSEGVDFSWSRPGGAAIKAAGKTFVMRYLYPDGQGGKGLDASEVADYRAHGLAIGVVFESSGNRALSGFAGGAADAQACVSELSRLGLAGTPVYFAVDFAASAAQIVAINAYLNGGASVLGKIRTGVYGSFAVVEGCVGVSCDYGWQTYAWSAGRISSKANVYQYKNGQTLNGGSVDLCRSLKADFGAFGATSTAGESGSPIEAEILDLGEEMKLITHPNGQPAMTDGAFVFLQIAAATMTELVPIYGAPIPVSAEAWQFTTDRVTEHVAWMNSLKSTGSAADVQPILDAIKALPTPPAKGTFTLS